MNSFSVFGKDFNIFGMDMPANPAAKAFLEEWYPSVAQKLVVEGKIKPHGYRVIEGGLRGVKDGWKLYETNAVSAQKLVYRVGECRYNSSSDQS